MARQGAVGEHDYEQVEALANAGMTKAAAIAAVAAELGKQAGTVQANYYRVARKKSGGRRKTASPATRSKAPRRADRQTPAPATATAPDIDAITQELVANVEQLARAIKQQGREAAELRLRLDGVRLLLE